MVAGSALFFLAARRGEKVCLTQPGVSASSKSVANNSKRPLTLARAIWRAVISGAV